jgi:CTP-dependent riboflavin kinase
MSRYAEVFTKATGQALYAGTLNVKVAQMVPIKEHFRILGRDIGEPQQDLLFEICRVRGKWAYRVRPFHLGTGGGGHGDNVLEIVCAERLKCDDLQDGDRVDVAFFG